MRRVAVLLFAFVICINAHAVLRDPVPFNKNPTTTRPCGVNGQPTETMRSTAAASWRPGETVTITWNLVASDGGGDLTGAFDPLGGTDFTVPAWTSEFPTSGSNKFYNKTFIVPADLNCDQSPTKLCTFHVNSPGWHSCTMVEISANTVPPPAPPKACVAVAKPLTFCANNITGASVSGNPSDIDSELESTYEYNLAKDTVFATPNNKDCRALYKDFLCASSLPSCDPKTGLAATSGVACKSQCQKAMKTCGLTELHKSLYDCSTLPECNSASEKSGSKSGMSPGGAAALSIFLIALVSTLAVLGYIYYKKGQLFGYMYDKEANKIVKAPSNPHNYTAYVDSSEYKM